MADLAAGSRVLALDFPPAVAAYDNTQITDITSTSFIAGSPVVSATFTAPTTGRVVIAVAANVRDSAGTQRVFVAAHIESVTTGLVVATPNAGSFGITNAPPSTVYEIHSRDTLLEGLIPGDTYFARLMYRVNGGSTADIRSRQVTVTPAR